MKKTLSLGASAFALFAAAWIAPAMAADMYPAPAGGGYKDGPAYAPNTWTGFYLGVNGGYGWSAGNGKATASAFDDDGGAPFYNSSQAGLDSKGGFAGGQAGYNWQRNQLVFGVEADLQGSGISGKARRSVEADLADAAAIAANGGDGADVLTSVDAHSRLDWFGTVRGRLGYAFDRTLVYATGGLAFGHVRDRLTTSVDFDAGPHPFSTESNGTRTGFVVGGGLEYALTPSWSLKGEYQFIDLGSSTLASGSNPASLEFGTGSVKIDHSYNTVRAGLNYHILPAYEPLK
jgi:outer membrane immunogenic protein